MKHLSPCCKSVYMAHKAVHEVRSFAVQQFDKQGGREIHCVTQCDSIRMVACVRWAPRDEPLARNGTVSVSSETALLYSPYRSHFASSAGPGGAAHPCRDFAGGKRMAQ